MELLIVVLHFLRLATPVFCIDMDRGYPLGFFNYGDKNGDGTIDKEDLDANLNLGWLKDWYLITKNLTANRDMKMTRRDFTNLLTALGILRLTTVH